MRAIRAVALATVATAALAASTLTDWPARNYRDGDFFQYWAGAHALLEGADPYDLGWWTAFHARAGSQAHRGPPQPAVGPAWTTAYPLWTLAAFVPIALLPFPLAAAVWVVAQLAAVGLGLAALAKTILQTAPRRDGLVLAGIALGSQPLWLLAGNGNVTGFLFGALAGAAALGAHPLRAGALLGTLALKPQSVALAALALLAGAAPRARWRIVLGGAVVVVGLVALSFAVRPAWITGWLRSLAMLQGSSGSNATLWTLGRAAGIPALSVMAPIALLSALALWVRIRRPEPWVLFGAAVPVSVAVSPHGWSYDQLYLLITVAVVLELLARLPPRGRLVGLGALAMAIGPLPWLLYLAAFVRQSEDWSALVPVLAFTLVVLADRHRSETSAPGAVLPRAGHGHAEVPG